MNKIIIYGPGCAKCNTLAEVTQQAMKELGIPEAPEKVTDVAKFAAAGVLVTPTLEVNGKLLISGKVPSKDELKGMLQEALQDTTSEKKSCCGGREIPSAAPSKGKSACGCDQGGCCGGPKGGAGWKKTVVIVVVILILLALVKLINHREGEAETRSSAAPVTAVSLTNGVEVVYYEYGAKCAACIRMEKWAKEAIEEGLHQAIQDKKLAFRTIRADEETVSKYGLTTKSLILKEWKDGKEAEWKNLDQIWNLNGDEEAFKKYVIEHVREHLEGLK